MSKKDRRIDHHRARQADRAAIRGDHVRQPNTDRWGHRPDPTAQPDECIEPTPAPPANKPKGTRAKRCKRNKNGPHVAVSAPIRQIVRDDEGRIVSWPKFTAPYVCDRCGKNLWGHKPDLDNSA